MEMFLALLVLVFLLGFIVFSMIALIAGRDGANSAARGELLSRGA